jgi:molybdopterin molybdotransferase
MIAISKATKLIEREARPLGVEKIALGESIRRVLAEDIVADSDLPPFDRSQMDGYAVVAADTETCPADLTLVGESAAGRGWHKTLKRGEAIRIMTGAPIPAGADSVQKVEVTEEIGENVRILEPTEKGRFIVKKGSEIRKGKVVIKAGEIITENMIATLAAFGYARVKVVRSPQVAIIGTGSEIVEISNKPGRDQIRNSNSIMLNVLCRKFGATPSILPNVRDDISELRSQISNAAKNSDIVVLTGGVSVGKYDHTKTALDGLGAEIFFEKVRLKPGKPAVFAKLGKTLIFGLPGNPVSAAVTFHLFVRKAILLLQSASEHSAKTGFVTVLGAFKGTKERDVYLPARLATTPDGRLTAETLRFSGSSDFVGFARADALVVVPRGTNISTEEAAKIIYL